MHFPSFIMLISSARQKDKLLLRSRAFFLSQSNSKRLFHDTRGGTLRIIIAYLESIIAGFEDIWQSKLSPKMLIDVDHDSLRTVLLQMPNTSHFIHFRNPESLFSTVPRNLQKIL